MEKRIGKIENIRFGMGGYQDAMIGVSVTLGSSKEAWGVQDFRGAWAMKRTDSCQWTDEDRLRDLGNVAMWVNGMLKAAKVDDLARLQGKPVEVTFDGNRMVGWRLLEEAL